MATKVIMPQLGESVVEGTVSRWIKQEGEQIAEYESLLEVSTDKVDSEIPSPAGGVLLKILVPPGETVRAGTTLAWIGQPGESVTGAAGPDGQAQEPAAAPVQETTATTQVTADEETTQPTAVSPASPDAASVTAGRSRELGFISPIVARMAQEHNLDLSRVRGTGDGGRITKKDVLAYLETRQEPQAVEAEPSSAQEAAEVMPWETPGEGDLFRPTEMVFGAKEPKIEETRPGRSASPRKEPAPTPAQAPPSPPAAGHPQGRLVPHSAIRRKIAEHMVHSVRTAPHVTTVMEADLSRVVAHLAANRARFESEGRKLTYTAYFAAAAVQALQAYPIVNSSWTDEGVLLHPQVNLGMAVSLGEEGLIVPVIKNAGDLSLAGLARAIQDLAARARSSGLQPDEVRDGTFTITNHGISGSLFANPIINQPQCAILGVGAVQKRVVVTAGDAIAVRPMVYLSLTFDHRILDGAGADGFLKKVVDSLENYETSR